MASLCIDCSIQLPVHVGRGRPRLRCDDCRDGHQRALWRATSKRKYQEGRDSRVIECPKCGGRCVIGKGSAKSPMCRACRRLATLARNTRECQGCHSSFANSVPTQLFCSSECYRRSTGTLYATDGERRDAERSRNARKSSRRRALIRGSFVEDVDLQVLADRDGWVCHLCSRKVRKRAKVGSPMSPSIDHIVPLSRGGEHSYMNTALAHLRCNLAKQNNGGGQLLLVG